jgi:hypothetical protein
MILTVFAIVWRHWHDERMDGEGGGVGVTDESAAVVRPCDTRVRSLRPSSFVRHPLFAAGVLAGLLPLFHTHTYVAVGLMSVFLFAMRPRREWLAFWLGVLTRNGDYRALGRAFLESDEYRGRQK